MNASTPSLEYSFLVLMEVAPHQLKEQVPYLVSIPYRLNEIIIIIRIYFYSFIVSIPYRLNEIQI